MSTLQHTQINSKQPLTTREGHKLVLTLLRAGASEQAEHEYVRLGLDQVQGDEDILALGGRILKSRALEKPEPIRTSLALEAAEKYQQAYQETRGTYSGINTAAMFLVGKDTARAQQLAREVLNRLPLQRPRPGEDAYYHMATTAEAKLILADIKAAKSTLADAIQLDPHNYTAHASTLVQFQLLLETMGQEASWLDAYRPPPTVHYAGHIFGYPGAEQALDITGIRALENTISDTIAAGNFGFAYGALAAGADILIAEQMLASGAELHVVLPCNTDIFLQTSVQPFGEKWLPRFEKCLSAATSVRHVSATIDQADSLALAFGSEVAMGHAVLKAQSLATEALQLLLWNPCVREEAHAGTARDAAVWSQAGRRQITMPYPFPRTVPANSITKIAPTPKRALRAMIFADVRGFGALSEAKVPLFLEKILVPLSRCVRDPGYQLLHINTWGDGLYLVLESIEEAAKAALALQRCFQEIDLSSIGLPAFLALRVAGHYGPVFEMQDPFLGERGFFGTEVSFAARIEPVTVPGSIYVSEPFACALAANTAGGYRCEYIGEITPRKEMAALPLFSLRHT